MHIIKKLHVELLFKSAPKQTYLRILFSTNYSLNLHSNCYTLGTFLMIKSFVLPAARWSHFHLLPKHVMKIKQGTARESKA